MNGPSNQRDQRSGGIDPAALAGASVAAALSVIAPPGPYGPGSMAIGVAILALVLAYDLEPHRWRPQSFAFSAIVGVIALLTLGYPLECIFATDKGARIAVLLHERKEDLTYSEVPPIVTLLVWILVTGFFYWRDRKRNPA